MAILDSNRARPGHGVLAAHLGTSDWKVRVNTDSRPVSGRESKPDRAPTPGARLDPEQPVGTKVIRALCASNSAAASCPCDRCPQAALCSDLQLACRAFSQFVRGVQWTSTARRPTHKRYVQLFASEASGEPPC
jgi:hypothetical protein